MVLSSVGALVPALVVPDEQAWTMSGSDPASLGVEPALAPARVRRVLMPDSLPHVLAEPLVKYLEAVPPDVELPTLGELPEEAHEHAGHAGHEAKHDAGHDHRGGHDDDGGHGDHDHHDDHNGDHDQDGGHDHPGHDHHDMMAIVGEPSADGLVMEPLEFRLGPLGTPLPGGLVADVTLDGDVVAECKTSALLRGDDGAGVPDPLTPQTWQVALAAAHEVASGIAVPPAERWGRIARVEAERALSHAAWLRGFARLLGWPALVRRTSRVIAATLEAQRLSRPALEDALSGLRDLAQFVEQHRAFRWRVAGRAPVDAERAHELGLRGPVARASGLADDARLDDPLYRHLGFEAVVRSEGDALARALVRAHEAVVAIDLAMRALRAAETRGLEDALPAPAQAAMTEGPRGPVHARLEGSHQHVTAHGADAVLTAAGEAVVGSEWSAALVGLASFDLSPWRPAG